MNHTRFLIMSAAIAALYAVRTIALAPISYGPVQIRLSEAMTLLAFVNRKWLPGLVLGCFIANLASPFGPIDIIVGTIATFVALWPMRYTTNMWLASLFPAIANGVIIAGELLYIAEIPMAAYGATALYIGAGELVAVTIVGQIIIKLLLKNQVVKEYLEN